MQRFEQYSPQLLRRDLGRRQKEEEEEKNNIPECIIVQLPDLVTYSKN